MQLYQPTITGSLAVSGSVSVSGSITIAGGGSIAGTASVATTALTASSADNFLTRGTLTAQTIVVQTITSSIDFVTGSTQFGSKNTDIHTYTGSLAISGSSTTALNVNNGALFVTSSGNVGIGTTNPIGELHIVNPSGSTVNSNYLCIEGATTNNNHYPGIELRGGTLVNNYPYFSLTNGGLATTIETGYHTTNFPARAAMVIDANNYGIRFLATSSGSPTNAVRMQISSSGKVGIGTTNADNSYQGLTIFGSDPSLRLKTNGASGWTWIEFVNNSGTNNFSMGVNQTQPQFVIKAGAGMDSPNLMMNTSGNVGIGTTSPGSLLQVGSSAVSSGTGSLVVYGFDGAADFYNTREESPYNATIQIHNNPSNGNPGGSGITFRARSSSTNSRGQAVIYSAWTTSTDASRTSRLTFQTVDSGTTGDKVTILGNGNVGIGTINPSFQLHVIGQIYSSTTVSAANSRILNQQSSNTYTNNSANSVASAIAEASGIIRVINNLDGANTDIPFYAMGGSGVAYRWTVLDPDTGWLINQSGWNFDFTTNGSSPRTFNLQASNGSGTVTIQQSTGTANYTMKIFTYAGA